MSKPQVRSSQIITTFGPGSMVDLPDDAVIIAGTAFWKYSRNSPLPIVLEPRLQKKLEKLTKTQGIAMRKPPPAIEDKGFTPDIGAYRFPEWFIVQRQYSTRGGHRARRLVHLDDLEKGKYKEEDGKRYPVVPVRFVRACVRGHVGDVDWHAFVHGPQNECRRELRIEERGTSGDLDAVYVCCACGVDRAMSQAARMNLRALGHCNGSRPWLGPGTRESCGEVNRLLIRSASNAYFPQLLSVISIPDSRDALEQAVRAMWDSHLSQIQDRNQLDLILQLILAVRQQLDGFSADDIMGAIQRIREGAAADERPVKEAEFDALARTEEELGIDEPEGDFYARMLPKSVWSREWTASIERVVLVHRLREVVAQVGFTRFEAAGPDIQGELDIDVKSAPLSVDPSWVPAIENRGEGIFIQFRAMDIDAWLQKETVKERDRLLQAGFGHWNEEHKSTGRQYAGLPYYMLHSLSHLLLTAISLECGYPASSLRERVYAMPGRYGILLYTGSPDAEGTLGGLVEEGRRIHLHLSKALHSGELCSNDPVCALHRPSIHDQQPLLGSACHGCLLISETSCEQHNDYLDRALVVPTVEGAGAEFFTRHE